MPVGHLFQVDGNDAVADVIRFRLHFRRRLGVVIMEHRHRQNGRQRPAEQTPRPATAVAQTGLLLAQQSAVGELPFGAPVRGDHPQQHDQPQQQLREEEIIFVFVAQDHDLEHEVAERDHLQSLQRSDGVETVLDEEKEHGRAEEYHAAALAQSAVDLERT